MKELGKTAQMETWHPKKIIDFNGQQYSVVDKTVDFVDTDIKHFASVGSHQNNNCREIFVIDADNNYGLEFLLNEEMDHQNRLDYLAQTIAALPKTKDIKTRLENVIKAHPKNNGTHPPIIPFEKLNNENVLVCRHRSLFLAIKLGQMIKKGLIHSGTVHQYRDLLLQTKGSAVDGGHTWVYYHDLEENKKYVIDPMLKKQPILCLSNPTHMKLMEQIYGGSVIKKMRLELNKEDANNISVYDKSKEAGLNYCQELRDRKETLQAMKAQGKTDEDLNNGDFVPACLKRAGYWS